jgi:hypothetical protein
MHIGLAPGYCARCASYYCDHALQINEHNMRVQHDRSLVTGISTTSTSFPGMDLRALVEAQEQVTSIANKPLQDKKILLLLRRTK